MPYHTTEMFCGIVPLNKNGQVVGAINMSYQEQDDFCSNFHTDYYWLLYNRYRNNGHNDILMQVNQCYRILSKAMRLNKSVYDVKKDLEEKDDYQWFLIKRDKIIKKYKCSKNEAKDILLGNLSVNKFGYLKPSYNNIIISDLTSDYSD